MIEKIDNHSLATLVSIFVSVAFYFQVILTIKNKNNTMDMITLVFTFLTLYTLYNDFHTQYNKVKEKDYRYVLLIVLIAADVIMTVLLTVFLFKDFSKMSLARYQDNPYYKYMLYASYTMLVFNFLYLLYVIYRIIKNNFTHTIN